MGLIEKDLFVCVDCESTGLDPKSDRIIEVAAAKFTFSKIEKTLESLVNPGCEIPELSQSIHQISLEMVQDKPKVATILPELLELIDDHILMGHGIEFDIALIAEEAKRANVPCKIEKLPFIDSLRLARLYGESPINSLEKLRQHFNIENEGAHRAMNDVVVNIEVFKYLSKQFKTTEQILKRLEKPIKLKTMPLGKHKGRRFEEIPIEYLLWASRKDFDQDLLYSLRLEIKNRKRGKKFEQASNPFSNL